MSVKPAHANPLIAAWAPNDRLARLLRANGSIPDHDAESQVRAHLHDHPDSISAELANGLLATIDDLRTEIARKEGPPRISR